MNSSFYENLFSVNKGRTNWTFMQTTRNHMDTGNKKEYLSLSFVNSK